MTNLMLDIQTRVGQKTQETQANVSCVAYAISGEELVFAAFVGAQTAIQAVKAFSYTKGYLQLSAAYTKAHVPNEKYFQWHYASIDSLNKGCSYFINASLEMVIDSSNKTYVMDKNPDHKANFIHPDTVKLIGQRIKQISNAPLLPEWYAEVVKRGREYPSDRNPLIQLTKCKNCRVWSISVDGELWAKLISELLSKNVIKITKPVSKETE